MVGSDIMEYIEIAKLIGESGGVLGIIYLIIKVGKFLQKFDSFVISTNEKFAKIDTRIDKVEENLTKRIDKLEDRIFWMMADKSSFHNEKVKEK